MTDTVNVDAIAWPAHRGGLHISHNTHHGYYETAAQAIQSDGPAGYKNATYQRRDFLSEAEIATCIATESVWTVQWYPDHPGSFFIVHAATLSRALNYAMQDD